MSIDSLGVSWKEVKTGQEQTGLGSFVWSAESYSTPRSVCHLFSFTKVIFRVEKPFS
mgnify:CR=1 FL=1